MFVVASAPPFRERTPSEFKTFWNGYPSVARSSQRWADGWNPVGIHLPHVTHLPKELVPPAKLTPDDPTTVEVFECCLNGQEISPRLGRAMFMC